VIRKAILRWARNRKPDFVIGGQESPYLRRHWLLPRNPFFNVYVHEFLRSDDDRALHDHPWLFNASWLLQGYYFEHSANGCALRLAGDVKFRWGPAPHRIELLGSRAQAGEVVTEPWHHALPCWTLFITGPRVREWGFLCQQGWVHWKRFTAPADKGSIGAGCDQ
jgi:hypothetical protein